MQFKTLLSLTAAVCLVQAMSIPASLNERVATTNAASTCNSDACADMCLNKGQVGICIKQKCQCQNVLSVTTMSQNGTKTTKPAAKSTPAKANLNNSDDDKDDKDEDDED